VRVFVRAHISPTLFYSDRSTLWKATLTVMTGPRQLAEGLRDGSRLKAATCVLWMTILLGRFRIQRR
jgi:hypothetical protein